MRSALFVLVRELQTINPFADDSSRQNRDEFLHTFAGDISTASQEISLAAERIFATRVAISGNLIVAGSIITDHIRANSITLDLDYPRVIMGDRSSDYSSDILPLLSSANISLEFEEFFSKFVLRELRKRNQDNLTNVFLIKITDIGTHFILMYNYRPMYDPHPYGLEIRIPYQAIYIPHARRNKLPAPQRQIKAGSSSIELAIDSGYTLPHEIDLSIERQRLQIFATHFLETRHMASDLIGITACTGESNNKIGATALSFGVITSFGDYVVRDIQYVDSHFEDKVIQSIPASNAGSVAGKILGNWKTRNIQVTQGTFFVARYSTKSVGDPLYKNLILPLVADNSATMVEFTFPVIADRFSTLSTLTIQGRLRIPTEQEFEAYAKPFADRQIKSSMLKSVRETYDIFGNLSEHWKNIENRMRGTEASLSMFRIRLNQGMLDILVRKLLPALREMKQHTKKEITSQKGKKIIIAKRSRRVKI